MIIVDDMRSALANLEPESVDAIVTDPPYELGFMGKSWDSSGVAFSPETWAACLRVLKPGGHLLAFGGTRTWHRIAVAIEDAGVEVRDSIAWMYGTGFPKSLDVSKAIDKTAGIWRGRAGAVVSGNGSMSAPNYERTDKGEPATDDARLWEGWGTALKPAFEPVIVARKPLVGTVAANVLAHGTGALNIDGCRVGRAKGDTSGWAESGSNESENGSMSGKNYARDPKPDNALGRWPANVILDDTTAEMLDGQSAEVARFFYCAKASTSERERGLDALPVRDAHELVDREEGSDGLQSPRAGAGRTSGGRRNIHPTVKPIALMRYLVRLVTPPGGLVLDPFAGSGTTGVAAVLEGFRFLGIEMDTAHACIAWHRIDSTEPEAKPSTTVEQPSLF